MAYLLDTNVFIEAKNRHYGFDICPAFWEWLILANIEGKVFSIDRVKDEIEKIDDELSEWARSRTANFFLPLDIPAVSALSKVTAWTASQIYSRASIESFRKVADYYLVAQAQAGNHSLVTHEKPLSSSRNKKTKIKIPDACKGLGINCVNPFEMLRQEHARFVLSKCK